MLLEMGVRGLDMMDSCYDNGEVMIGGYTISRRGCGDSRRGELRADGLLGAWDGTGQLSAAAN